jgi:hypothetical protein
MVRRRSFPLRTAALEQEGTTAGQPLRPVRSFPWLLPGRRQELKFAIAEAQPTP